MEKKLGTKIVQEVEMTPVDKTKNFFKIYLYVDKATKTIYSSRVLDKNGNKYMYTINSLNGNANVTDASFVFDKAKYPGVEEVDLKELMQQQHPSFRIPASPGLVLTGKICGVRNQSTTNACTFSRLIAIRFLPTP